jgi:hypothetical protein
MSFHHAPPRVLFNALGGLAVASGLMIVGCGPAGAGSNPSSKAQMKEFYANEAQKSPQMRVGRSGRAGKVAAPKNIKGKLFNVPADQLEARE